MVCKQLISYSCIGCSELNSSDITLRLRFANPVPIKNSPPVRLGISVHATYNLDQ